MAKTKGKKGSKKSTKAIEEPVVEVVAEPVVVAEPEKAAEVTLDDQFKNTMESFMGHMASMMTSYKAAMNQMKQLQKLHNRQVKQLSKKKRRKNTSNGPRKPSGFAKPTQVSDALCKFLGEKTGTLLARTDVTKRLTVYIKDKDLQNPENKKHILVDAKLKKLLGVTEKDDVTYFNLQKYMKHHYISSKSS